MNSFNGKIVSIFSVLVLSFGCVLFGQNTTSYYKLVKIIYEGDIKENTKGGQFITFSSDGCYDSDINGVNVGNGKLQLYSEYSNSKVKKYFGNNYFGNAIYKFSANYDILNVEINKNYIYVYHRAIPPNGARTSSLIKKQQNNTFLPSWDMVLVSPPTTNDNTTQNNPTNSSTNNTNSRRCIYCNGTGQITKNESAPPNFGIEKPQKRCPTCGEWYNPNVFNHYHIHCSHCNGTGWAK